MKAQENEVFVLIAWDAIHGEAIIGVCDYWDKAKKMIRDYFNYKDELEIKDVRDSGIEFTCNIIDDTLTTHITLHSYFINSI